MHYSFRLTQKNRNLVKLQILQSYIYSKKIKLQHVKSVIILSKMVSLLSLRSSPLFHCQAAPMLLDGSLLLSFVPELFGILYLELLQFKISQVSRSPSQSSELLLWLLPVPPTSGCPAVTHNFARSLFGSAVATHVAPLCTLSLVVTLSSH